MIELPIIEFERLKQLLPGSTVFQNDLLLTDIDAPLSHTSEFDYARPAETSFFSLGTLAYAKALAKTRRARPRPCVLLGEKIYHVDT